MMMPSHSNLLGHLPINPEIMANQMGLVAITVADKPDDTHCEAKATAPLPLPSIIAPRLPSCSHCLRVGLGVPRSRKMG